MTRATAVSTVVVLGAALWLGGCEPSKPKAPPAPKTDSGAMERPTTSPTPPVTGPSERERKESTSPQQGQVDPKAQGQTKDFEQKK